MKRIQILDDSTINQIAAGEVVENPASVVKELIENSIDAQAKRITVEIEGGGFRRICVSDDGDGMESDDALLALQRHATSKIRKADDLVFVSTMGFRGEALASIGAVSKLKLITSKNQQGVSVQMQGGAQDHFRKIARTQGTTIEVCQLFYNVPARLKFQKSQTRARADVVHEVMRLCLAHPSVAISLFCEGIKKLTSKGLGLESAIQDILGEGFIFASQPIDTTLEGMRVFGRIGHPKDAKSTRKSQYVFINNRPIHSRTISNAVKCGYGTRLSVLEYPLFALHIEFPSEKMDVNVHPQKKKVRFSDPERLERGLRKAIEQTLSPLSELQPLSAARPWEYEESSLPLKAAEPEQMRWPVHDLNVVGLLKHYLFLDGENSPLISHLKERGGFVMVDLRRAAERVFYEKVTKNQAIEMQALVIPLTCEYAPDVAMRVRDLLNVLEKVGIGVRPFGERTFVVDRLHGAIAQDDVEKIIEKLAADENVALQRAANLFHQKRLFHLEEARAVVQELLQCSDALVSPSGKPIFLHWDDADVKRLFKKS